MIGDLAVAEPPPLGAHIARGRRDLRMACAEAGRRASGKHEELRVFKCSSRRPVRPLVAFDHALAWTASGPTNGILSVRSGYRQKGGRNCLWRTCKGSQRSSPTRRNDSAGHQQIGQRTTKFRCRRR
jgi:hypothetical protein